MSQRLTSTHTTITNEMVETIVRQAVTAALAAITTVTEQSPKPAVKVLPVKAVAKPKLSAAQAKVIIARNEARIVELKAKQVKVLHVELAKAYAENVRLTGVAKPCPYCASKGRGVAPCTGIVEGKYRFACNFADGNGHWVNVNADRVGF